MSIKVGFLATLFLAFNLGCTTKGNAPGGAEVDMPYVTSAVDGAGTLSTNSSVRIAATSGALINSQTCSICGSVTDFSNVFSLASTFAIQGKLADSNACTIEAIIENDVIPELVTGEFIYIASGDVQTKARVVLNGTEVASYEVFTCSEGVQVQYMAGTNDSGNMTFSFRATGSNNLFVTMEATGVLSGTDWLSKVLNVGFYLPNSSNYSYFTITQASDYLDISGIIDTGTLGTLDSNDVRLVSRAQLIGNTLQTYALGDGSIRTASGVGSETTNNWNGDTGVHGAGPTTYDSAVASATLPTLPTTRASAFLTSEQWDCVAPNGSLDMNQLGASNSSFMTAAMACQEVFQ